MQDRFFNGFALNLGIKGIQPYGWADSQPPEQSHPPQGENGALAVGTPIFRTLCYLS